MNSYTCGVHVNFTSTSSRLLYNFITNIVNFVTGGFVTKLKQNSHHRVTDLFLYNTENKTSFISQEFMFSRLLTKLYSTHHSDMAWSLYALNLTNYLSDNDMY